jgi:hypothetical protein
MAKQPVQGEYDPGGATKLGLPLAQSEAEIAKAVAAEVAREIAQSVDPLQSQISQYGREEGRAIGQVGELYGTIQPSATASTQRLGAETAQTVNFEKAIFDATQARIAAIRGQAGASAQQLAQQIGAPVPVGLFDQGTLMEQGAGAMEGAGGLLTHSGMRQAALQESEAFSGRVFPLMRKEAETSTRAHYSDLVTKLQQEITSIKKQKPGLINERTRARLLEERGYQLERIKAQRDWDLAKYSANLENRKLLEAKAARKAQTATDRLGITTKAKTDKASLAIERKKLGLTQKELDQRMGEYNDKKRQAITDNVSAAIQAFMSGGKGKLKTITRDPVTGEVSEEYTRDVGAGVGIINNPNQLMQAVLSAVPNANRAQVANQVASAFRGKGMHMPPKWVPGQAGGKPTEVSAGVASPIPKTSTLNKMSLERLEQLATRAFNFQGNYPEKRWRVDQRGQAAPVTGKPGAAPARTGLSAAQEQKAKTWLIQWLHRIEAEQYAAQGRFQH